MTVAWLMMITIRVSVSARTESTRLTGLLHWLVAGTGAERALSLGKGSVIC